MGKFLLLCRVKYDFIELEYHWFASTDEMQNFIKSKNAGENKTVFIDYAAEIITDKPIIMTHEDKKNSAGALGSKYLLLCRIKHEEWPEEEVYYGWFDSVDMMQNFVRNKEYIYDAKVYIDYAGEILSDRIVMRRQFDINGTLSEVSKVLLKPYDRPDETYYIRKLYEEFGIYADQVIIKGYPLSTYFRYLERGHSLEDIEKRLKRDYFIRKNLDPPKEKMGAIILSIFIVAINICEEEQGSILRLDKQLVKYTIPKYFGIFVEDQQPKC